MGWGGRTCVRPPHPLTFSGYPVTGGVNAPMTPILGAPQPLCASGWKRRIPGLAGLTDTCVIPCELVGPEILSTPAPVTRTRAFLAGLPSMCTDKVSVERFPAVNECGEIATASQP